MAQFHEHRALVEREEVPRPVAELLGHVAGIGGECLGGVAPFPPTAILQRLRQVPVIERREWRDAVSDEVVEEPVVEVEALRIWRARALREYARPRNREPIRSESECLHRLHVVPISVIVIIGDVAVVVVADLSRRVRKRVPDRGATTILADGAFDLIGGGGGSPEKSRGKGARGFAPGQRSVARPSGGRGGGRRRSQRRRTTHGKLASREPCGHKHLRNRAALPRDCVRSVAPPPTGETANGEQRPAWRLEGSWRLERLRTEC